MHFRVVDMNAVPDDLRGFDFSWSSGAVEHLGSLAAGADFVLAQMDCLRPGGVAVHTTEFLVSSDVDTVEAGGTVFYRRRDVEGAGGAACAGPGTTSTSTTPSGRPPRTSTSTCPPSATCTCAPQLGGYVTTSVALVVTKGARRRSGWWRTLTGRG